MVTPSKYISCLIRMWYCQAENNSGPLALQIQVENIQTGQGYRFNTLDELFHYLKGRISLPTNKKSANISTKQ